MLAVTGAAERLVAVGLRGLIATSSDDGRSWLQAQVPVESDLVAVQFPTARHGWAVGHDGVVLSSDDGGRTWRKVLDGRQAAQIVLSAYETRSQSDPVARFYAEEARRTLSSQPDTPFLDVHFLNETEGFIVGNFGTILHTADAGRSWQPWMDRLANDDALHLTAIRRVGSDVYLCGERGQVWRLDAATSRFMAVPTPYKGTLFGLTGRGDTVLVFGLRGNVYRTENRGQNWTKVETGIESGVVAGAALPDGRLLLLGQGGEVVGSTDEGRSLQRMQFNTRTRLTSIHVLGSGAFVLSAIEGLRRHEVTDIPAPPKRPAQ